MSSSELLLTLIVALCVFGPKKLPMLAHHLGQLIHKLNAVKSQLSSFWQSQIDAYQFEQNLKKAETADKKYHSAHRKQSAIEEESVYSDDD